MSSSKSKAETYQHDRATLPIFDVVRLAALAVPRGRLPMGRRTNWDEMSLAFFF